MTPAPGLQQQQQQQQGEVDPFAMAADPFAAQQQHRQQEQLHHHQQQQQQQQAAAAAAAAEEEERRRQAEAEAAANQVPAADLSRRGVEWLDLGVAVRITVPGEYNNLRGRVAETVESGGFSREGKGFRHRNRFHSHFRFTRNSQTRMRPSAETTGMYRIDCREKNVFLEIGPEGIVGVAPTKQGERIRVRAGTGEFGGLEGKVMNIAGEDAICEIGQDHEMQILPLDSLLLLEEA